MAARAKPPQAELRELEERLKKELPRAVIVRGEEPYFHVRALELCVRKAKELGFEVARHDGSGPDCEPARLIEDLSGRSLFDPGRLVVLQNADPLLKKEGRSDSSTTRAMLAFLADEEHTGGVLVAGSSLRADHALVKAAKAAGGALVNSRKLYETAPPWDPDPRKSELVQWFNERARAAGLKLTPDEALYVTRATGNDLAGLETQIEKLRTRGDADLARTVGWSASGSPFAVADALLVGDLSRSLAGLVALFRGGFQGRDGKREVNRVALSSILLGDLNKKLRQTLAAAELRARGIDLAEGAEEAGIPRWPRGLAELSARLEQRPAASWPRMLGELASIERRTRVQSAGLDLDDFLQLALRWRQRARSRAAGR